MRTATFATLAAAALANPPHPGLTYRLRFLGDPILTIPATPVESLESIPRGLVDTMRTVCKERRGLGLSAQQVGGLASIALVTIGGELVTLINPRLINKSPATERGPEGCLSIPGFYTTIERHEKVVVQYLDDRFIEQTKKLVGLEARCVQHEIDHLAGKLIVDGLPRQQRRMAERMAAKAKGGA